MYANQTVFAVMLIVAAILLVRHLRRRNLRPMDIPPTVRDSKRLSTLGSLFCVLVLIATPANAQRFDTDRRSTSDSSQRQSSQQQPKAGDDQLLLREGTQIPPATGRIVLVGRRWGFAPDNPNLFQRLQATNLRNRQRSRAQQAGDKRRPTRLGRATILVRGPDLTRFEGTEPEADLNPAQGSRLQHILLVENLMLHRIVEAIIQDPADDRWSITGEIFEFRNQNRLLIRTAQRASSR